MFAFVGLTKHASILAHMFTLVEGGGITVPLFDQSQSQNNNMTNEVSTSINCCYFKEL